VAQSTTTLSNFIILFAGATIFKIGQALAKLQTNV